MCGPAAAMVGIAVVQGISSYRSDKKAARRMNDAIGADEAANREALAEQARQENEKALDDMSERAREAALERGRLEAIAADSGVTGNDHARLMRQSRFNEGFDITSIDANRDRAQAQIERGVMANTTAADRDRAAVRRPSALAAGLQIAGTAASAYAMGAKK